MHVSFNSHNFSTGDPMSTFLGFSKAYKETVQIMCLNPNFRWCRNLSFFAFGPWAIVHGIAKLVKT